MAQVATEKHVYDARWEAQWGSGLDKGQAWDVGHATPTLQHLLSSGELKVEGQRCLVPGCGRGYDVFALAAAGAARSVGLDLARSAVQAAHEELAAQGLPQPVVSAVQLVQGDFFTFNAQPFDVGYDYTFGCAMHPSMRQDWAASWARLLRPGAQLVTMVFPVRPEADPMVGPPFPVSPQLYEELLTPVGFKLLRLEQIPEERSIPKRAGQEWLAVWQRQ